MGGKKQISCGEESPVQRTYIYSQPSGTIASSPTY